jgi:hypothetical protein
MSHWRRAAPPLVGLLGFLLVVAGGAAEEARPAAEYAVKAQFLERFTRFVTWPASALPPGGEEPFVLGVVGRDPFGPALDELAARRRVAGHRIEVRRVRQPAEIAGCHLLFVAGSESERLDDVLAVTAGRPILTVGDTSGFARRGVLVNLFVEAGKVGFEVNESAAQESGLAMSSKLMKLARRVEEDG